MNGWGKNALGVSLASSLGLVLFPMAVVFAQSQQGHQPVEQTSQSVDLPKEETKLEIPGTSATATGLNDYVIGPEDILNIDVFNVPELSKLVVRVANDGNISLPLIGQVLAAGMTAERLRSELEIRFGRSYLENPQITLYVQEFHARPVSVIGAVERPGLYQLTGPRTLIEVLSTAGGLAKRSSAPAGRFVYVTRLEGFGGLEAVQGMRRVAPDKVEIDIRRLLYSHEDALNIEVKPRDIISVSKADVVYVTGNGVKKPGGYVLEDRDNVTILQALAMAEGLSANAAQSDAHIIRTEPDGSRKMIPFNLKKVLKGSSPDLVLADNDILFIPDSSQKAMLKGGATTVVSTLSWLFIYGRI
ncbi:MAG: polysaccharide biosynthesis/export family protein [Terriglobia bacterium]